MSDQNRDSPHRPHRNYDEDFPPLSHLEVGTLPSIRSLLGPQRPRRGPAAASHETRPVRRGARRPGDVRRNPSTSTYERARPSSDQAWEEGNAHLHLRNLLARSHDSSSPGRSLTPGGMTSMAQTHRPHDLQEDNRRAKRRKVDVDRLVPDFGGFRYGTYGQVKPGALKMEIVSCDGGMFLNEQAYAADNILRSDGSVYCAKGNRCNIVLRHQGATVFNLTELVVKTPSANYSSPVREGLVFVTMSHDDQLLRTAQYQIPYSKPAGQAAAGQSPPMHPSAAVSFAGDRRPLRRSPPPIMTLRRRDGTVEVRRRNSLFSLGLDEDDLLDEDEDDEEDDEDEDVGEDEGLEYRLAQVPREFSTSSLLPFNVTTECSDDEGLDPSLRTSGRNAPDRIGSLPFESDDSDDEYRGVDEPFFDGLDEFGLRGMSASLDGSEHASSPAAPAPAGQESGRGANCGDLMAPHARFNIERGRSKCTIQFDPPISGRFILLKMWSPRQIAGSNIDIQTVVAKGFCGPRYFPAVKLA